MAGIAYHPWYAVHGTKDFSDDKKWYETTVKVSSLYDCIVNAGTGNGRPDDKEANISYLSGQGGILCYSIPNANKPTYTHQEEVRRNLVDGYIENGVEIGYTDLELSTNFCYLYSSTGSFAIYTTSGITVTSSSFDLYLNSTRYTLYCNSKYSGYFGGNSNSLDNDSFWTYLNSLFGNNRYITYGDLLNIDIIAYKKDIVETTIRADFYKKSPYLATMKNMLHTDIIGDPSPYSSSDATYIANDGNADTDVTDMPISTLVWDSNTSTMWKTKVDTIDLTDSTPSVAIEEGDNWTEVKKGYPQELRSLLASGRGIGFCNSLLIGQDGSDYTNCKFRDIIFSKKIIKDVDKLRTYDNFSTSGIVPVGALIPNFVDNGWSHDEYIPVTQWLVNYIAQNQPAIQIQSPKPIKTVDKDLIATNSHSIYSYNGLNYAASGKVATGSSIESKGVDDVVVTYDIKIYNANTPVQIVEGTTIVFVDNKLGSDIIPYMVYRRNTTGYNGIFSSWNNTKWDLVGFTSTTPKHSTLTLDNQSITASKALISQTENATQVFTQEISSGWDGTSTFEDDVTTGLTIGTTYKEATTGGLYVAEADKITVSDTATWSYPAAYNDFGTFKQLTTGTTTDNSMNTIQTKVLLKASSIKV